MAKIYKKTNPTSSDNISAGYALNDVWVNIITYDRYTQVSDGEWYWTAVDQDTFIIPNEYAEILNSAGSLPDLAERLAILEEKAYDTIWLDYSQSGSTPTAGVDKYWYDLQHTIYYSETNQWVEIFGNNTMPISLNKIYIDRNTQLQYAWSGSIMVALTAPLVFASQTDAETGTDNSKVMTPLRVVQSIMYNAPISQTFISKTYAELYALTQSSGLTVGQRYLISDYQTVHEIPNTSIPTWDGDSGQFIWSDAAIHIADVEPLLVTALSTSKLANECYSTLFPQDIIYYDIESNQAMVKGCTKGYIYRRIDTLLNNDIDLDFRNVRFRIYKENATTDKKVAYFFTDPFGYNDGGIYFGYKFNIDYNYQVINSYVACDVNVFEDVKMFKDATDYKTEVIYNNKFCGNTSNLVANRSSVFFGNNFNNNNLGNNFNNNTVGSSFYNNNVGINFYGNTVGNNFYNNTVGSSFYNNSVGDNFYYNFVGDGFIINNAGNSFHNNTIGDGFQNNTVSDSFNYNNEVDFTSSTYVYMSFNKELFTNAGGEQLLKYYDETNTLIVLPANQ